MELTPIVNGLEAEFGEQVNFVRLNVGTPDNELIQQQYGLRGHPAIAILDKEGKLVQSVFGVETEETLRTYLGQVVK